MIREQLKDLWWGGYRLLLAKCGGDEATRDCHAGTGTVLHLSAGTHIGLLKCECKSQTQLPTLVISLAKRVRTSAPIVSLPAVSVVRHHHIITLIVTLSLSFSPRRMPARPP